MPDSPPILVLGAGRFGRLAVERLSARRHPPAFTVVDPDTGRLAAVSGPNVAVAAADAVDYVAERMDAQDAAGGGIDEWIVPAVPIHLTCEVIVRRLSRFAPPGRPPVPEAVAERVPHPLRGDHGQLYASNADFICPDDCPEPADHCTVTGRPRPVELFSHLAALDLPGWRIVVLPSRQLAPGVGGYRRSDLLAAEGKVRAAEGPVMIATACRCHGVIDALDIPPVPRY